MGIFFRTYFCADLNNRENRILVGAMIPRTYEEFIPKADFLQMCPTIPESMLTPNSGLTEYVDDSLDPFDRAPPSPSLTMPIR